METLPVPPELEHLLDPGRPQHPDEPLTDGQRDEKILVEFFQERRRQDAKWRQQNPPSVTDAATTALFLKPGQTMSVMFGIPSADVCRESCQRRFRHSIGSWADIALEEFAEAIDAANDETRRGELVQLGAVVSAWIAYIDRKAEALRPTLGERAEFEPVCFNDDVCGSVLAREN